MKGRAIARVEKEEKKHRKAKHLGKSYLPHQSLSTVQEKATEILSLCYFTTLVEDVFVFFLFQQLSCCILHIPDPLKEALQGRGNPLQSACRPKELHLIELACFLPKLLFCSSCHEDAPVRRMCLKISMTSQNIMGSAPQYSHPKLHSDSREQAWIF